MARTMLVAVSTLVFGLAAHAAAPAEMRRVDPLYRQLAQLEQAAYDVNTIKNLAGKTQWKPYEANPVIKPGDKGRWDAGALGSMSVLKVGNIYHIYYEAWGTRGTKWSRSDYQSLQVGHAAEILKVDENLYLMYYGPQGYFDAKDCDIRLAIYNGDLDDLAGEK